MFASSPLLHLHQSNYQIVNPPQYYRLLVTGLLHHQPQLIFLVGCFSECFLRSRRTRKMSALHELSMNLWVKSQFPLLQFRYWTALISFFVPVLQLKKHIFQLQLKAYFSAAVAVEKTYFSVAVENIFFSCSCS